MTTEVTIKNTGANHGKIQIEVEEFWPGHFEGTFSSRSLNKQILEFGEEISFYLYDNKPLVISEV